MSPDTLRNQLGDAVTFLSGTLKNLLHYLSLTLNPIIDLVSDGLVLKKKKKSFFFYTQQLREQRQ